MKMNKFKGLFTSVSVHWATPMALYRTLDAEFNFNDDPCPLIPESDGLSRSWGDRTFCNPPYGKAIGLWLKKAYQESHQAKLVVCLIPSRTDTQWWHDYVMKAEEIRFIRGRLKFGGSQNSAPFPSAIVIFNKKGIIDANRNGYNKVHTGCRDTDMER